MAVPMKVHHYVAVFAGPIVLNFEDRALEHHVGLLWSKNLIFDILVTRSSVDGKVVRLGFRQIDYVLFAFFHDLQLARVRRMLGVMGLEHDHALLRSRVARHEGK